MISIYGNASRFCSGLSRRELLRAGGLTLGGLTLADLYRAQAVQAASGTPAKSAKNCIVIYLPGGPSHIDTFDPKPDAPAEVRGEFGAIKTKIDGVQFCDLLPKMAALSDKMAVLRSVRNTVEEHSSSHLMTGYGNQERAIIGDRPSVGSVLWKMKGQSSQSVPAYVTLSRNDRDSGNGAGYLEPMYEPLFASGPGREDLSSRYAAVRLDARKRLLSQIDGRAKDMLTAQSAVAKDAFTARALDVLSSTTTRDAFDLSKEKEENRKKYAGVDNFMTARRLLEAGVNYVTLDFGGWDTHGDNFKHLKTQLPQMDQAYSTLINDLDERGLLKETLVVLWGEFGRTPRVNGTAGRDHWPAVMSCVMAGAGIRNGVAVGTSDSTGSYPHERSVHVRNVVATMYSALGIDPQTEFIDRQNRPLKLIPEEEPITELL